jgi:glucose/mannose transport system substrate-binding protein
MKRWLTGTHTTSRILNALALATALLMPACGSGANEDPGQTSSTLELYSWWTAPGEKEALDALLDVYKRDHPQVSVINAALTDAQNAHVQLTARMTNSTPPDTFQCSGGSDLLRWVAYNGRDDSDTKMDPLDDLAKSQNWKAVLPQPLLDVVTYNSKMYGVPLNVHRMAVLYYNKKIFADNGLTPPSTMAEFRAVGDALKAKNIVPLAVGSKNGWPVAQIAIDGLFAASALADFRDSYLAGNENPSDPRVVSMLDDTAQMLSYANDNRDAIDWDDAAKMLVNGKAAMTIMGDWTKGFFVSQGLQPDVDFGQAPMPGANGVFVFITDTFGLPKGATGRQAALEFLTLVGSVKGQSIFNPIKGSTPPRTDADLTSYDVLAKSTAEEFRTSRLVRASPLLIGSQDFNNAFAGAMKQLAVDGKVEPVVNMLKNRYDLLKPR